MDSALLLAGLAVLGLLELVLLRRMTTHAEELRFSLVLDRERHAAAERAELDRTLRRRLRQLRLWVEDAQGRLGAETRTAVARLVAQRGAEAELATEAACLVAEVRELHAVASAIVRELRALAEEQRRLLPRVPERRPPPLPKGTSAPPSEPPVSASVRSDVDEPEAR